jgi:hypothetical protein
MDHAVVFPRDAGRTTWDEKLRRTIKNRFGAGTYDVGRTTQHARFTKSFIFYILICNYI